jgi:hypothetical protein
MFYWLYSLAVAPLIYITAFITFGIPVTLLLRKWQGGGVALVNGVFALVYTVYWAVTPSPWPFSLVWNSQITAAPLQQERYYTEAPNIKLTQPQSEAMKAGFYRACMNNIEQSSANQALLPSQTQRVSYCSCEQREMMLMITYDDLREMATKDGDMTSSSLMSRMHEPSRACLIQAMKG